MCKLKFIRLSGCQTGQGKGSEELRLEYRKKGDKTMSDQSSGSNQSAEYKSVEGGPTIDKPLRGLIIDKDESRIAKLDTLKTFNYAKALAEHIKECGTPLTVGVQGEWGSGKTSLLNMMKEQIEETEHARGNRKQGLDLGKNIFKTIWINTW